MAESTQKALFVQEAKEQLKTVLTEICPAPKKPESKSDENVDLPSVLSDEVVEEVQLSEIQQKALAIKSKQIEKIDAIFMADASSALFFKPATRHQQAQSRLAGALAPNHRGA